MLQIFYYYFLSDQLQYIRSWTNNTNATWLETEQAIAQNLPSKDLPFIDHSIKTHPCYKSNTIYMTLTAWWKANKIMKSNHSPSTLTPLWHNPKKKTHHNISDMEREWSDKLPQSIVACSWPSTNYKRNIIYLASVFFQYLQPKELMKEKNQFPQFSI